MPGHMCTCICVCMHVCVYIYIYVCVYMCSNHLSGLCLSGDAGGDSDEFIFRPAARLRAASAAVDTGQGSGDEGSLHLRTAVLPCAACHCVYVLINIKHTRSVRVCLYIYIHIYIWVESYPPLLKSTLSNPCQ